MPKKVVVVLPTFNEKDSLEHFTQEVLATEKQMPGWKVEVVITDSSSPDGTGKIAEKMAKENPRIHYLNVERGLGAGLIRGHLYSAKHLHPDVMAQLDADGQVEVAVLPKLVQAIEDGYDLALGSRFVPGGKNDLSLSRRIFSIGASWVVRVLMGPFNIKEVTNSARAFTPELFSRINLDRMPWKEKTFIVQPAFLHEAIMAGARYKEVPLIFRNRAEGYSKNKTFNYTYDVITYAIDARLHSWGLPIPFFKLSRRAKTFLKFGLVGATGTIIDFLFYKIFINYYGLPPATAKALSTSIAIVNNFVLNDIWTFRGRKNTDNYFRKFGTFVAVSSIGLGIAVIIVKVLHEIFGDGFVWIGSRHIAYNNFYFFATIPPVMLWNFLVNHFVTWRHKKD